MIVFLGCIGLAVLVILWAVAVRIADKEKKERLEPIQNDIDCFAKLYIEENSEWPDISTDPQYDDINALISVIKKNHNIVIYSQEATTLVKKALHKQRCDHFYNSIIKRYHYLAENKNPKDWAKAYAEVFKYNQDYIQYAANSCNCVPANFIYIVNKAIKNREEQRKIIQIENAMKTGEKQFKKISINDIDIMDPFKLEEFVGTPFNKMGYKIEVTKSTGDQGADVLVEKQGIRTVIQAKRYSDKVGNKSVQEVVAAKAVVITNNYFTNSAVERAKSNRVELIDRGKLEEYLKLYF